MRRLRERFPDLDLPPTLGLASPTPLERWERLSRAIGAEVIAKREDRSSPLAGGNKVRKLDLHLAAALAAGARAVATVGPAGSNHVLATVKLAAAVGLPAIAVLAPQAPTPRAVANLRAIAAGAAELHPAARWTEALARLAAIGARPGVHAIPPGGSTPRAALGHGEAALEVAAGLAATGLPVPTTAVLPLGTASTAAGFAAGFAAAGLPVRTVGVLAGGPPALARLASRAITGAAARLLGLDELPPPLVDETQVGPGYSIPTAASEEAARLLAETEGLAVDPTYASKSLAALIARARAGERGPFLFVVTCPPQLPVDDPDPANLPPHLRALFR